jgi:hypothetical protein
VFGVILNENVAEPLPVELASQWRDSSVRDGVFPECYAINPLSASVLACGRQTVFPVPLALAVDACTGKYNDRSYTDSCYGNSPQLGELIGAPNPTCDKIMGFACGGINSGTPMCSCMKAQYKNQSINDIACFDADCMNFGYKPSDFTAVCNPSVGKTKCILLSESGAFNDEKPFQQACSEHLKTTSYAYVYVIAVIVLIIGIIVTVVLLIKQKNDVSVPDK